MINEFASNFLQLSHYSLVYSIKKPIMHLENGMLIISIDIDVGSRQLGIINKGKNDTNISKHFSEYMIGEIEETIFPYFLKTINDFEIPATFAIRGQLTEIDNSLLKLLLKSPIEHDIGAHGYTHRNFTDLSYDEAEDELKMISKGMKKLGIAPKSFVFPKNGINHLDLLQKYGYRCYRGYGNLSRSCMHIEKEGRLYNVHPSLYIQENIFPMLLKRILDIAITKKLSFHMWLHLWNFGQKKEFMRSIGNTLIPLFDYAKKKEAKGELTFETMLSAAMKTGNYPYLQ